MGHGQQGLRRLSRPSRSVFLPPPAPSGCHHLSGRPPRRRQRQSSLQRPYCSDQRSSPPLALPSALGISRPAAVAVSLARVASRPALPPPPPPPPPRPAPPPLRRLPPR
eukprot:scaffold58867_cov65-Phaeocystis_antarctica.AAC.9